MRRLNLAHVQAGHDRLAGAGVVGQQEAQRSLPQHLLVDGDALVRQRVDQRGLGGECGIDQMPVGQPVRLHHRRRAVRFGAEVQPRRRTRRVIVGGGWLGDARFAGAALQLAGVAYRTENPSTRAACERRRSLHTKPRVAGSPAAAKTAAASCMASAARNGCARKSRNVYCRRRGDEGICTQPDAKLSRYSSSAWSVSPSRRSSRWRRFSADAHSTQLPHHVMMWLSAASRVCRLSLVDSSTSSAVSAEGSQYLSDRPPVPR